MSTDLIKKTDNNTLYVIKEITSLKKINDVFIGPDYLRRQFIGIKLSDKKWVYWYSGYSFPEKYTEEDLKNSKIGNKIHLIILKNGLYTIHKLKEINNS